MVALARGVDVSRYQTVTSWDSVRKGGYQFAIVKATEGDDYTSSTFFDYYRGARASRLATGSYHFGRPGSSSAVAQARHYARRLREAGFKSRRDLPPVLDVEDTGGLGKSGLTDWCLDFVRELDAQLDLETDWLRCGIYCNRDYYSNRMDGRRVIRNRWWWLAEWPSGQDQPTDEDEMPSGAAIWQWTDQGNVPGIRENTDLNVARKSDLSNLAPDFFEDDDMPVFRHYALRKPFAIKPVDSDGKPRVRPIPFEEDVHDPKPGAHAEGGSSYIRRGGAGWATHELAGLQIEGMKSGDLYQIQITIYDPDKEDYAWTHVLTEGRADSGNEYVSAYRTLRTQQGKRVRWRFIYRGKESDVKITRADWIIKEY